MIDADISDMISDLEPHRFIENMSCDMCGHAWNAVAHVSVESLECGECGFFSDI